MTTIGSEELLLLAGQGSRKAMGEFYRRYKARVISFLLHMGVEFGQVDDVSAMAEIGTRVRRQGVEKVTIRKA